VVDICDESAVARAIHHAAPAVCINVASFRDVAAAEEDEAGAFRTNSEGADTVARACAAKRVPLIHASTDFVFRGNADRPYREDDKTDPTTVYGRSKLAGEVAVRNRWDRHLIFRTSWVHGSRRKNFVQAILARGLAEETIDVVDDEVGCPTSAREAAEALLTLARSIEKNPETPWGTYHCANAGAVSRFNMAQHIVSEARRHTSREMAVVVPTSRNSFGATVERPHYSVLDCTRIRTVFGIEMRPWRDGVDETVRELLNATAY
jgi:dTDP-4-dehydrorhamnose reductase